jgi:hypothetical protein
MVEYIRPMGHPLKNISLLSHLLSSLASLILENPLVTHHTKRSTSGRRVLRISKRPDPVQDCLLSLVHLARTIELQLVTPSYSKKPSRGNPGCVVRPKTPTAGAPGTRCVTDPS